MADFLNSGAPGTCGSATWKPGVEQDAGATKGCAALGLDLANKSTEYDIVKLEADQLYYGARPADGSGLDTAEKRPTSLQPALARAK